MREARARRGLRSTVLVAVAAFMLARPALAADPPTIVIDRDCPVGPPDHFFVDFDVPEGIEEIEIHHDDKSASNILDFGLYDVNGYRGWGGGTSEAVIVNTKAASRAYVPGPIMAGRWRVVVGKAKVNSSPARVHVEVTLRSKATLTSDIPRKPYVPVAPLKVETRYYAGDLHVHSKESTDADPTIEEDIALAKSVGLEFIEISDHNTITQLDYFTDIQAKEPSFLLMPGIEFTTYDGHANAIGATHWVDHKIGLDGVTIEGAADAINAQGAVMSINHPVMDVGGVCIGCAWRHDLDPKKLGGVEIGTLGITAGAELFRDRAIAFWDAILDKGVHAAALGGSDDHKAGKADGLFPGKVGSPTTLVRATELSAAGILAGIKKGATVVKLDSNADAMVELEATSVRGNDAPAIAFPGDTVNVRSVVLRAKVLGGVGQTVRFVHNGIPEISVPVTSDPFFHEIAVAAPKTGEDRWRAEALVDAKPRTVTSHVYVHLDPNGIVASEVDPASGGCNTTRADSSTLVALGGGFVALFLLLRRRRLRAGVRE